MDESAGTQVRCSPWARAANLDPLGSIGCYRGYLFVTWPLPWPRDVGDIAELQPVAEVARRKGVRVQLLVPRAAEPFRIIRYLREPLSRSFRVYGHQEQTVSDLASLPESAVALLGEENPTTATSEGSRDARDVMICTHGRRDRCCGSFGTALYESAKGDEALSGVRVWRTSHTGGHRFAPTALVMPEGTAWAFLNLNVLAHVVRRDEPFEQFRAHYRGCSGLSPRDAQLLEGQALVDRGWSVLDAEREATAVPGGHRLDLTWADGSTAAWDGAAVVGRHVSIPPCGGPSAAVGDPTPEWVVQPLGLPCYKSPSA